MLFGRFLPESALSVFGTCQAACDAFLLALTEYTVKRTVALWALAACASLFQLGCHRSPGPPPAKDPPRAGSSAEDPAVDLSAAQLQAIQIEPAGTRKFPVEFEAVGSVSFEEDPAIVQAESALLIAQANLEAGHRELLRVQGLGETNGIAPKEQEGAQAADLAAAAAVKAARDTVRALGVSDQELDALQRTGRFALPKGHGSGTWVLINVPESDTPKVRAGELIRVTVSAYPEQWFRGVVRRVYATVDPGTHRTAMRAQVEDPRKFLRPGMLANVMIQCAEPVTGVAIPTTAVVRESDGTMVAWITADRRRFISRRITVGQQDDGHYQVLAGLKTDDLVVTEGGVFLTNLLDAPPSD
jgi:multidrug efflux pump subunit AcrA (membrane-fusion protein)